tara:strand:+ start:2027 stop:2305 length:279 start_codon:yes stop_codon:yes gene_type:complete
MKNNDQTEANARTMDNLATAGLVYLIENTVPNASASYDEWIGKTIVKQGSVRCTAKMHKGKLVVKPYSTSAQSIASSVELREHVEAISVFFN